MDVRYHSSLPANVESSEVSALRGPTGAPRADQPSNAVAGQDSSRLSSISTAVAQVMQQPEMRQECIASLQSQIAGGTYQVASGDVADAMMRTLRG